MSILRFQRYYFSLTIVALALFSFLFSAQPVEAIGGDTYPKELRVLEVKYFPAGNDYVYDPAVLSQNLQGLIETSSAFQKYKNAAAQPSIDVNVLESTSIQGKRPSGNGDWEESYKQILIDNNLCQKIHDMDVDQVWVWADPRAGYDNSPGLEYVISSPLFRNPVQPATIPSQPFCNGQDSFVFFEFDFSRTADLGLHSYGHFMEGQLGNLQGDLFWKNFTGENSGQYPRSERCGNVHFPPNGRYDYDYGNTSNVRTACENWNPLNTGTKIRINCTRWGCTQEGYLKWWMQNMPNMNNTLTFNGKTLPNWWDFQVDFEEQLAAYKANSSYYLNQAFVDANQPPIEAPQEVGEVSTAYQNVGTSLSWNHTVSGADPLLLVSVSYRAATNPTAQLTSVTYGGQALTFIRRDNHNHRATEMWYLANAPVGTATISATWSANPEDQVFAATTVNNVYNANPIATHAGAGHDLWDSVNPGNQSITLNSSPNQIVIGALSTYPDGGFNTALPQNDTAEIWTQRTSNNNIAGQGGAEAGASSVTLNWHSNYNWSWAISAVSLRLNAAPSVSTAVSTDKADYTIGVDTSATISVVMNDENGTPITGLGSSAFVSLLDNNSVTPTFSETATAGTYTTQLDISTLAEGNHTFETTVTDGRTLSGTGSAAFTMSPEVVNPTQSIVQSITYTLSGGKNNDRNIVMTTTVRDDLGNVVPNAAVTLNVKKNGTAYLTVNGITDVNGKIVSTLSNAPTGCYTSTVVSVTATGLTWDGITPSNSICK